MQIGFIGVGKITNAIVEGLCTSSIQDTQIWLSPRNEANARQLAEKYAAVQRLDSNQQVVDRSDIVFVAVRPAVAVEVLQELVFRKEQIVVSLVPLLKEADLLAAVAPVTQVARAVPTPAVMTHTGPVLVYHGGQVFLRAVICIRNNTFGIFGYPLVCTGRTFGQLPFIAEQVFKEIIAPFGRGGGPYYFKAAGNGVCAFTGTIAVAPSQALLFQVCRFRLFAYVGSRSCAMIVESKVESILLIIFFKS